MPELSVFTLRSLVQFQTPDLTVTFPLIDACLLWELHPV